MTFIIENAITVTSQLFINTDALCVYAAADRGHPLLLYTGAVFLPVLTLFTIHRHQEEGKNEGQGMCHAALTI